LVLLTIKELLAFAYEFMKYCFNENWSRNVTMKQFTKCYGFSEHATNYIDVICRVTDGGTIDNYTLFEFFEIFNQNVFYKIYQPKLPNDVGLFKYWLEAIKKTKNVDMMFDTEIIGIVPNKNKSVDYVVTLNKNKKNKKDNKTLNIIAKNYIFALPPKPMINIIKNSPNQNMFGDINELIKWEEKSSYLVYIPINFHWDTNVKLEKVQGITESDYGIVYVVMSNYMKFNDPRSKVVITCTVKATDRKSQFNKKTANECSKDELIEEVFRQLKIYQPHLPKPTYSILNPGVYKNGNKWDTVDTAYFYTKAGYKSNKSIYNNLFWVGSHNGNSNYNFTAMETAMGNAISLLHEIEPKSKNEVIIHQPVTLKMLIFIVLILIIIWYIGTKN